MPRVMINDRALRNPRTGVGHYVAELIAGVRRQDPDIHLLPFYQTCRRVLGRPLPGCDTGLSAVAGLSTVADVSPGWGTAVSPGCGTGVSPVFGHWKDAGSTIHPRQYEGPAAPPPAPRIGNAASSRPTGRIPDRVRRVLQDLYHLAFETTGHLAGFRLYHEPNHIPGPWHGPILTTVHDLSVLRHPEWHPADRVAWYEREFAASLPRSEHFITVSEFTRSEMIDLLGVRPERITAIPLGPRALFHPRPPDQVREWLAASGLPEGFVLYVGTIEPRKNLPGVLAAYARLPAPLRRRSPLLIVGMTGWAGPLTRGSPRSGFMRPFGRAACQGGEPLDLLIRRHRLEDDVRPLGYLDDQELALLYNAAAVLIWPSFYEGFGLPPLESMASGTPVVASRAGSITEIVGDAGLLLDPRDEQGLADALASVLEDPELAASLSTRGLNRSRHFSWDRCAAEHARLYRQFAL